MANVNMFKIRQRKVKRFISHILQKSSAWLKCLKWNNPEMIILFQRIGETEREREGKRSKSQVNILDVPILIKNYIIAIFIRKKNYLSVS